MFQNNIGSYVLRAIIMGVVKKGMSNIILQS